jgi:calcineurin-like phosphoesterase family protein
MAIWVTADHHFGHKNIAKYENRPDDWERLAVERWNEVVNPGDLVYHLGDFSFMSPAASRVIMNLLNGHVVVVIGNHDSNRNRLIRAGAEEVYGTRHGAKYGEDQFYLLVKSNDGRVVALSHAPLASLPKAAYLNYHGHIHSNDYPEGMYKPWHRNVSVDVTDYRPILLQ